MLKVSFLISCTLAFIFLTTYLAAAQQNPPDSTGKTCEAFAKEFYTWYLSAARAGLPHGVWPLELTLKAKPPVLSEELVRGINDVEAEAKRTQDAGLDFDPVLNSQDSGGPGDPPYLVRDVKVEGDVCRADIYDQSRGGKAEKIVIPELRAERGGWIFTNFRYPNFPSDPNSNLIRIIRTYLRLSKAPKN